MKELFKKCLAAKYTTVENNGDFAIERDGETLRLLFEWSDGAEDWKNNFKFFAIPWKPYKKMNRGCWFCHRGFLKVWKSIEPYVKDYILIDRIKKIEIVGYSHGAAIAQLCYEYVKYNRPDVEVIGCGFGAPRVFWGFASKKVKERFKNFVVVRNGRDVVTHLPPFIFGYRHICKVLKIGKNGPIKDHYPERYLAALEEQEQNERGAAE